LHDIGELDGFGEGGGENDAVAVALLGAFGGGDVVGEVGGDVVVEVGAGVVDGDGGGGVLDEVEGGEAEADGSGADDRDLVLLFF